MSSYPSYTEHTNRSDLERRDDKLPYHERLVRAMGESVAIQSVCKDLAWVAFNYVRAQSRLEVLVARAPEATKQEITAQSDDVAAWQRRASSILSTRASLSDFYGEVVSTMATDVAEAHRMDADETNHLAMGLSGRIDEIVVEPETHVYHYDDY